MALKRKLSKACVFSLLALFAVVFYIEVVAYTINTRHWPLPQTKQQNEESRWPLRVLLVADPQLIGENNEKPFIGVFARWDADRYLAKNFMLAIHHLKPHIVAFLGDIFDEGSSAEDEEYRRYAQRLMNIFHIPRRVEPSPIEYIFIPGDNDVGGEGVDAVNIVKLKWFNRTFGDYREELSRRADVQFLKVNLFLPEEYQISTNDGREQLVHGVQPNFRILLSHMSILFSNVTAAKIIVEKYRPQIVFSAHSHYSSYFRMEQQQLALLSHREFLIGASKSEDQRKLMATEFTNGMLQNSDRIQLHLNQDSGTVHEISVPTCSYRNGVANMGFGALLLYENGTLEYTVLWLPSRFRQLLVYVVACGFLLICHKRNFVKFLFRSRNLKLLIL